jgi:hypothetical protein
MRDATLIWNIWTALPQVVCLLLLLLVVAVLAAALCVTLTSVLKTALWLAAAVQRALVQALAAWTPSVSPLMPAAATRHTVLAETTAVLLL